MISTSKNNKLPNFSIIEVVLNGIVLKWEKGDIFAPFLLMNLFGKSIFYIKSTGLHKHLLKSKIDGYWKKVEEKANAPRFKLWIGIFIVFGLTLPGTHLQSTVSVAVALSIRLVFVVLWHHHFNLKNLIISKTKHWEKLESSMTLFSPQIFCGMSIKAKSTKVESRTQCSRPRPRTQKKIQCQGQGQPFRGQTFSRPRTGRLEAKAYRTKDTGASSLQKKN